MRKIVLGFAVLMLSGLAAGQPVELPDEADNENSPLQLPSQEDVGSNGVGPNASMLPGQASDTARNVVSTVSESLSSGVQGVGEALQELFGAGEEEQ